VLGVVFANADGRWGNSEGSGCNEVDAVLERTAAGSRREGYTRAKIENGQGLRHSPFWGSARRLPVRLA
jgi:hypothetical protein